VIEEIHSLGVASVGSRESMCGIGVAVRGHALFRLVVVVVLIT